MDLFTPGSGEQVHDHNGGIQPSGLFWTVPLPDHTFTSWGDGRHVILKAKDVPVIDTFQFGGPFMAPATVSFDIRWDALGPTLPYGAGAAVAPTDPAAFLGQFALAGSTGTFSGTQLGFRFRSDGGVSSERGFAQVGHERNGAFL